MKLQGTPDDSRVQLREKLNIAATKHDDEAIWYGDVVEIDITGVGVLRNTIIDEDPA